MPSLRARFGYWLITSLVPAVFPRINPLARWLLRSPLHPIASLFVIMLRFHGAASGRIYEVPLAYHRRGDGVLKAMTSRRGRW